MATRSPRGSLRRQDVVDAALTIIERDGPDGLTVRGLAAELERPPMTLYAHFRSKRELIDLAHDGLLVRLFARHLSRDTWQAEVEGACRHLRRVLLAHPHWIPLLTRVRVAPAGLRVYEHLLDLMHRDGFRPEAAMLAFSSLMSHALGAVLVERMMAGTPPVPRQRLALVKDLLAELPARSHPRVAAVLPRAEGWSFDRVFDVGLRALVAGLEESAPRRAGHGRRAPAR